MQTILFYTLPAQDNTQAIFFMKIIFKLVQVLLIGVLFIVGLYTYYNKPLPTGEKGAVADALASQMLTAMNYKAYKELNTIEWTFSSRGLSRHYKWSKNKGRCIVAWDSISVELNTSNRKKSRVMVNQLPYPAGKKEELIRAAEAKFNNDSFWLVAPYKVFDAGVERRLVKINEEENALLVTYTSGGTTPGDSYLWYLDENHRPVGFEMWVDIIPIGGVHASWDQWQKTSNGAYFPLTHKVLFLDLLIDKLQVN